MSFQRSKSPYPKKEKVGTNEIQQELGVRSIKPGCYRSEKKSRINENYRSSCIRLVAIFEKV